MQSGLWPPRHPVEPGLPPACKGPGGQADLYQPREEWITIEISLIHCLFFACLHKRNELGNSINL